MCKILLIPQVKEDKQIETMKFVKAMKAPMSLANNDGFGYAAMTNDNKVFGERWFKNIDAFDKRQTKPDLEGFENYLKKVPDDIYNNFGEGSDNIKSIMTHARMATCGLSLENVHPFYEESENLAMIHNGMIHNSDEWELKYSTCDSEAMLHEYLIQDIKNKPENIQSLADQINGYYAIGIMSVIDDVPYMDFYNGNNERVYLAKIPELGDIFVMSTSDIDIEKACRELKFEEPATYQMKDGTHIRINIDTGEFMFEQTFKPGDNIRSKTNSWNGHTTQTGSNYKGGGAGNSTKPSTTTNTTTKTTGRSNVGGNNINVTEMNRRDIENFLNAKRSA